MGKLIVKAGLMSSLAAFAVVSSTAAYAQSGNDGANSADIIVTARRTEERLQDVPISISVISQAAISDRNIIQGSDLALYTPSLTVNQRFGPETSTFAIRGFLQEANTAPSVGVYFAEVTTPRSLGLTAAGSNLAIGAFMDLKNTQVLKGPQGTLFGRNTTGGAVLVEPNRPTDKLEGYVEGSAGDYGMLRGQAVINVPLSNTFKLRLGVDRMKRDGYMKNMATTGVDAFNDTDYVYARIGVQADLTPDIENYTVAHYSRSHTNGFASRLVLCERNLVNRLSLGAGIFTGPSACNQLDRQIARGDGIFTTEVPNKNPLFKIEQWQAINHTTWKASDNLTVRNIISYASITSDLQYRLGGDNFLTVPTGLGLAVPVVNGLPYTSTDIALAPSGNHSSDQWTFTEELQLLGTGAGGRLNWQAGFYLEASKSPNWNEGYTNVFLSCPDEKIQALQCFDPYGFGNISNAKQKSEFNTKAIYAQATYDLTDRFSLTAGLRYTWDNIKAINQATRFLFPLTAPGTVVRACNDLLTFPGTVGGRLQVSATDSSACNRVITTSSSKPTWVINADYKPVDDLMLYAKWSRGYRAGGIAVLNLGLEVWNPERLDSYEIGAKYSFRGAVQGYFNIAGFYNDFSDQQLVSTTRDKVTKVSQGNAIVNAGQSTIKGIEVDSAIKLFDSLDLSLGWTYIDSKIKKLVAPVSPIYQIDLLAREGDPLPQVPKNRISLSAKYTLPLGDSVGDLSIGATFVHTDKQFFNRNSQPDLLYLPPSDLVNLNVNWNKVMGSPIDAAFFVTNLTNEAIEVVHGGEYGSLGYETIQYAAPRMWGFRLRYSFGQ